jgi:hypothetical protein
MVFSNAFFGNVVSLVDSALQDPSKNTISTPWQGLPELSKDLRSCVVVVVSLIPR